MKKSKGMLIAGAAASLILAGTLTARAAEHEAKGGEVMCLGINSCKGTGSCASAAGNSCAGQNSCKGKGVTKVSSAEECTKKGGKVQEKK